MWSLLIATLAIATPADTLPLDPGFPEIVEGTPALRRMPDGELVTHRTIRFGDGSPEAVDAVVLSIDGILAAGVSFESFVLALTGPRDRPVRLRLDSAGVTILRTFPRSRTRPEDLSGRMLTPRFVIHFHPAEERRARRVARQMEDAYGRAGLPRETGGRRGHVYLSETSTGIASPLRSGRRPPWAIELTPMHPRPEYAGQAVLFAYVAFGARGEAIPTDNLDLWVPVGSEEPHRRELGSSLVLFPTEGTTPSYSLVHFIRQGWGDEAFGRLYRAGGTFPTAVEQELGVSLDSLRAAWKAHILSLPPDPEAGPGPLGMLAFAGWTAAMLGAAVWLARRKEAA